MATGITITGLDDCLKLFDNAPENVVKAARKAMATASRKAATNVRRRIPKRFSSLVRSRVTNKGKINSVFGLFNGHQSNGRQANPERPIDDWFKAYWQNYGTLEGRDPTHHFDRPVNHAGTAAAKRRRGRRGIQHRNWFEYAIDGWRSTFVANFREAFKAQQKQLYER